MATPLLQPFRLERFFAGHEFTAAHLLCASDCEPISLAELLSLADADSLALWSSLRLGYTQSKGLPALRAEIAATYAGVVSAEDVLCCVPQEGITLALSLLSPGQHIVCTTPGYQSLYSPAEALGCRLSPWKPRRLADGALHYDVSDLRALLTPETAMLLVNFPHNPTGCTPTTTEWAEIVALARQSGAILFSDEVYRTLWSAPGHHCVAATCLYERAITLGALSKAHGLAGLRAGWLVTRDAAIMEKLCSMKDFTTICGSAPSEVLALMALRASDAILEKSRALVAANLALANAFFERWAHLFEWPTPQGGTVGFPRLLRGESAQHFCMRVLRGCGVLFLPSDVYDYGLEGEEPGGGERFRFGFGRADFPAVLARFEAFLLAEPATALPHS